MMNPIILVQMNPQLCLRQRRSNPYRLCLKQKPRVWAAPPTPDIPPGAPRLATRDRWQVSEADAGVGWGTRGWFLVALVVFALIGSFSVAAVQHFAHCRAQCLWREQARLDQQRVRQVQRENLALAAALNLPSVRSDRASQPGPLPVKLAGRPPMAGSRL
jgi:hypothetical protein